MTNLRLKYYQNLIRDHLQTLSALRYETGLFAASSKKVDTGYDKSWLRDNFYECLAFETLEDWGVVKNTYEAVLKIFLKHEAKIDHAIHTKPTKAYEYIHARFHPFTFDEFWEEWGNKQNDSIGAILFKIGEIEQHQRLDILGNEDNRRIVQKLIQYLESIQYWKDADNGVWENDEEIHASSVGACVAGLQSIRRNSSLNVPDYMISRGLKTLHRLLPRESEKRFVDLAELSLIYPHDIVTVNERAAILKNIEYHLVRDRGLIRYRNDWYYNANKDGISEEAEWTFGFSWLSIIYAHLGDQAKARHYLRKCIETMDEHGYMPELYMSNSPIHNENTPLGWAESLFVIAVYLQMKTDNPGLKELLSDETNATFTSSSLTKATLIEPPKVVTSGQKLTRLKLRKSRLRRQDTYIPFVAGMLNTKESIAIDRQFRKIFDKLNQTTSYSYHPHREMMVEKVVEFSRLLS